MARAALASVKADIARGEYQLKTRRRDPTLPDFVPEFLGWVSTNKSSTALDQQLVKPLCAFFGKRRLSHIERRDLEDYKAKRIAEVAPPPSPTRPASCTASTISSGLIASTSTGAS